MGGGVVAPSPRYHAKKALRVRTQPGAASNAQLQRHTRSAEPAPDGHRPAKTQGWRWRVAATDAARPQWMRRARRCPSNPRTWCTNQLRGPNPGPASKPAPQLVDRRQEQHVNRTQRSQHVPATARRAGERHARRRVPPGHGSQPAHVQEAGNMPAPRVQPAAPTRSHSPPPPRRHDAVCGQSPPADCTCSVRPRWTARCWSGGPPRLDRYWNVSPRCGFASLQTAHE